DQRAVGTVQGPEWVLLAGRHGKHQLLVAGLLARPLRMGAAHVLGLRAAGGDGFRASLTAVVPLHDISPWLRSEQPLLPCYLIHWPRASRLHQIDSRTIQSA